MDLAYIKYDILLKIKYIIIYHTQIYNTISNGCAKIVLYTLDLTTRTKCYIAQNNPLISFLAHLILEGNAQYKEEEEYNFKYCKNILPRNTYIKEKMLKQLFIGCDMTGSH